MAKVVTPITCKVIAIGRPKESTYTPGQFYHPVLFADTRYPEGDAQAKLWKNLAVEEVEQLRKGDTVQLVPIGMDKQGNPKHQIVKVSPMVSSREQQAVSDHQTRALVSTSGEWSDQQKWAIAGKVTQNAKLLRFCLETAQAQFSDLMTSEESIRCLATTLFLQAVKGL
jgi:hypothetical protein